MHRLFLCLLLLGLSGCSYVGYWEEDEVVIVCNEDPQVQKVVMIQVVPYSMELKSLYNLTLERSTVERRNGALLIRLDFGTMDIMTLEEARDLIVNVTEGLLTRLNHQQLLRDVKENGEITPEDLFINIRFESFFAVHIDPLYLGRLLLNEGQVAYYAQTGTYRGRDLKVHHHHIEPYFVSKEIVSLQMDIKRDQIRSRVEALKEEAKRRRLLDEQKKGV